MQLTGRPPAQYRLHAVIVHNIGHSLDAGHYFSFCRASGGGGGVDHNGWCLLDDSSAVPVSAAAALGRPHRFAEVSYTLLYRLAESAESDSELCRPPVLTALPGPQCVAVTRDYAMYIPWARAAEPVCRRAAASAERPVTAWRPL